MVRAVRLEVSASGSYYNLSQGIFEDEQGDIHSPKLRIYQANGLMVLFWPAAAIGFRLEVTDSLSLPFWRPDASPIQTVNATNLVVKLIQATTCFFRLAQY